MTIKELRKYRENLELLECVERQLRDKKVITCVQASTGPPSYEKVNRVDDGFIHGMGTVSLLAEQSRLKSENDIIKNYINAIPKERIYKALALYCLDEDLKDPSWQDVADRLGELDGRTLSRAVERYLKKY